MQPSCNQLRRQGVRLTTRIEAQVAAAGRSNSVTITNLSAAGLQLECSRRVLEELMPNIHRPDPHQPLQVELNFCLPPADGSPQPPPITLQCRMLYVRRLAQDRFLTGGEIIALSPACSASLAAYLSDRPRT
ncbi:MAG: hypothetical protein GYB33_21390 [Gammaproteobacteria bacterium]|nr:hypothetical protein [Gammaproteobacteria bacterium]